METLFLHSGMRKLIFSIQDGYWLFCFQDFQLPAIVDFSIVQDWCCDFTIKFSKSGHTGYIGAQKVSTKHIPALKE